MKFKIYATSRGKYNHPKIYEEKIVEDKYIPLLNKYHHYNYKTENLLSYRKEPVIKVYEKGSKEYNEFYLIPLLNSLSLDYTKTDVKVEDDRVSYKYHHTDLFVNLETLEELIDFKNEIDEEIIILADNLLEIYDGYRE